MRHMTEDHTAPEDIGKLAAAAHVKKVVLSHFVPGGESDPDDAYTGGVKKYFSGPVVAAQDLMEFRAFDHSFGTRGLISLNARGWLA